MNKKLDARALFYAIIVSVFVALMSASILLSSYHQHHLMRQYQLQERLLDNCQSGIELLLGSSTKTEAVSPIDLFGAERDSVLLEEREWGLLDVILSKSWSGQGYYKDSVLKIALIGKQTSNYALKLAASNAPLYVYGNTRIVGTAFLPREGIERGYTNIANGKQYTGEKLIYGEQKIASAVDKTFLKERFANLETMAYRLPTVIEQDSIVQGFDEPTLVVGGAVFDRAGVVLKGNIVVVAEDYIKVAANAVVEDVLFFAKTIVIEKGFQGSLQAFAWDSLVVEEGAVLEYPSVLGLLPYEKTTEFSPFLQLQERVKLTGTLMVPSFRYNKYKSKVLIPPTAHVTGQVWVNGVLEHRGVVKGNIFCEEFLLQLPTGVYKNYLLEAVIDRKALPKAYLTPNILSDQKDRYILKYF
ncbi:MAG: hypothetical protein ACRBFS_22350 [Aureispira sp.]